MNDRKCSTCILFNEKSTNTAQNTNAQSNDEDEQVYCWNVSPENGCMEHTEN